VSPPPIVGFANGIAQSIVSLARGFGPLLGGYVRAAPLHIPTYRALLTMPVRYGPQPFKETRRDTISGLYWLRRRAGSQSSTASSFANIPPDFLHLPRDRLNTDYHSPCIELCPYAIYASLFFFLSRVCCVRVTERGTCSTSAVHSSYLMGFGRTSTFIVNFDV
jgi:hypothetical protein